MYFRRTFPPQCFFWEEMTQVETLCSFAHEDNLACSIDPQECLVVTLADDRRSNWVCLIWETTAAAAATFSNTKNNRILIIGEECSLAAIIIIINKLVIRGWVYRLKILDPFSLNE